MNQKTPTTMMNECYFCTGRKNVLGNAHISCSRPDENMRGDPHGVRNGWFLYPLLFDPVWKTVWCANFIDKDLSAASTDSSG